jgi:hypothetical protein
MEFIVDAIIVFLGIGFSKAIVEPVARNIFRQKVIKYAPAALQLLDSQVPGILGEASGEDIEKMVREKLEKLTGESWSKKEIDSVFQLYDVRVGANKALGDDKASLSE